MNRIRKKHFREKSPVVVFYAKLQQDKTPEGIKKLNKFWKNLSRVEKKKCKKWSTSVLINEDLWTDHSEAKKIEYHQPVESVTFRFTHNF
jgi:uncharacterized protein HemY